MADQTQEERNQQTAAALVKVAQGDTLSEADCTAIVTSALTAVLVAASVAEGATVTVALAGALAAMGPIGLAIGAEAAISAAYVALYNAIFPVTKLTDVHCDPGNAPTGPTDPNWLAWNYTQGGHTGDPLRVAPKTFDAFAAPVIAKNYEDQLNCRPYVDTKSLLDGLVLIWNQSHDGPIAVRTPGDFATNPVDRAVTDGHAGQPALMQGALNQSGVLGSGIPGGASAASSGASTGLSTGEVIATTSLLVVGGAALASAAYGVATHTPFVEVWKRIFEHARSVMPGSSDRR